VGARGSGRFESISWEQAYDQLAESLTEVVAKYGSGAVYRQYGSGTNNCLLTYRGCITRLFNLTGGHLSHYNSYSSAQISVAGPYLYGRRDSNPAKDVENAKLLVMFGDNPLETQASGGGAGKDLLDALKISKAKVICLDPRYSDSAAVMADQWIPMRPGSDAAMALAVAYVLIAEDLVDKQFLNAYVVGYEGMPNRGSYKDYVLGLKDSVPKTPQWASAITMCPAETIEKLAIEIGTTKPCFITQGRGPQRTAFGEATALSIMALAVITGNVGISGGNTGDVFGAWGPKWPRFPEGENPIKDVIPSFSWVKAIKDGPSMTRLQDGVRGAESLSAPIKFLWNCSSNITLNQHSELASTKRVLQDPNLCRAIVNVDARLTPSAKIADIVLPSVLAPEQDEIFVQGWGMTKGLFLVAKAALKPPGEALSQYEIVRGLARRLGLEKEFTLDRSHWNWIEHLYRASRMVVADLPEDIQEAIDHGPYSFSPPARLIAFEQFRKDPVASPLSTPTGKIELYSERLERIAAQWTLPPEQVIAPIPQYHPSWEGPTSDGYPLQLIGHHYKGRVHSSFADLKSLATVAPQRLWLNPIDAEKRGLAHGDLAKVYNDRGQTLAKVKITQRIMPGVASLPQGAWFDPDSDDIDQGGCINALTRDFPSPLAKGNPQHTNRVEVIKSDR
jgi:DmsA/YnfE family anaerobic dimethyl sulfoxide reductase A subunit